MDLQLTAIVAAVWVATGLTRFVMLRPASRRINNTMYALYLDMGLSDEYVASSPYATGLRIARYLEFVLDLVLAPYILLRDRTAFFTPPNDEQIVAKAIESFRQSIYAQGEHIEMLEAYEAKMLSDLAKERTEATLN